MQMMLKSMKWVIINVHQLKIKKMQNTVSMIVLNLKSKRFSKNHKLSKNLKCNVWLGSRMNLGNLEPSILSLINLLLINLNLQNLRDKILSSKLNHCWLFKNKLLKLSFNNKRKPLTPSWTLSYLKASTAVVPDAL